MDSGGVPSATLVRALVALAACAALMAVMPANVAGAGLLPALGTRHRASESPRRPAPVPAQATRTIRVAPPLHRLRAQLFSRPVPGCSRSGPAKVRHGTRRRRRVALTFDDGPGPYTRAILRALRRVHVHATFFQIGRQIPGQNRLERRMVRAGHSLGDHSYSHPALPGRAELRATKGLIARASHYRPCLFRPPYGIVNRRLERRSRRLGMTVVLWNVDPSDYEDPGVKVIVERVVSHARPGSIIVLHDGGGMRAQTAAAVPGIVNAMRRRGYRFVTVDRLLGYGPAYSH